MTARLDFGDGAALAGRRRRVPPPDRARSRLGRVALVLVSVGLALALGAMPVRSVLEAGTVTVTVGEFTLTCPDSLAEGADATCTLENTGDAVLDWPVVALAHRSDDADRALVTGGPVDVGFIGLDIATEQDSGVWWVGDVLVGYNRIDWPRLDSANAEVESPHAPVTDPDVTGYTIDRSVFGQVTVAVQVANAAADSEVHVRHRSDGDWATADAATVDAAGQATVVLPDLDAATAYSVEAAMTSAFDQRVVAGSFTTPANTRQVQFRAVDDSDDESREKFYVSLAPSGSRGIGGIYNSAQAVHITDDDAPSSEAFLGSLTMASDSGDITLSFARDTYSYDVSVDYRVAEVTVTPAASHGRATISVVGTALDSGEQSHAVPLAVGANAVGVEVTAENGLAAHVKTYTINVTRAARPSAVTVTSGDFTLTCPATATEGQTLTCSLAHSGSSSAGWPVVGIIHSSADAEAGRALITEDTLIPASSSKFSQDLRLHPVQSPALAERHYGHGNLFSGGSRSQRTTYGYESFDWSGQVRNQTRSVAVQVFEDYAAEPDKTFYVGLAPSGYTGLSQLVDNKAPVVVLASTLDDRPTVWVSDPGISTAAILVALPEAAAGRTVHLRHAPHIAGDPPDAGDWTYATPVTASGRQATFNLSSLAPDTVHGAEVALDSSFHAASGVSFRTDPTPAITRVAVAEVSGAAATVQVEVSNAVAATMVHLRYRISGAWTTADPVQVTAGTARFALSSLTAGFVYELEAALDSSFTAPSPASFTTNEATQITSARTSGVTYESATVTVSVANTVSSTRVFLRYGVDDGDPDTEIVWTRVSGSVRVGSDGSATFMLSSLSAESDYAIQAALDSSFATPFPESFRTDPPPPEITGVAVGGVAADSAAVTVTVTVDDAVAATRVHLRFRPLSDTQWTPVRAPAPVSALGVAVSTLGGLAPGTDYEVQAALDPRFASSSLALFTTRPRQAAQTPGPPGPGGGGSGGGGSGGGGPEESGPEESEPAAEEDDPAVLAQAAASEFDDVTTDAYYAPAVGWMVQHGITAGCAADSFCPERDVSRQQFVTFLWRAAGRPQPATAGSQTFTDVTEGSYADTAIGWAAETGVTQGCATADDGTARFCPHRAVTRAQASALLYRHADARADTDSGFADVDPTSYYARAAAWMAAHGITNGCAHDSFCPHRTATRAQAATFIYRVATNPQSWGPDTTLSQPRTNTPTTQPMTTHTGISLRPKAQLSAVSAAGAAKLAAVWSPPTAARQTGRHLAASVDPVSTGASSLPALSFTDWRFPTGEQLLVYRPNDSWHNRETTLGFRYFGPAALEGGLAQEPGITFAVQEPPREPGLRYCNRSGDCTEVTVEVVPESGRLYLHSDEATFGIGLFVADFPDSRLELSAEHGDSGLRVHQEILVDFAAGAPDCRDYPGRDANRHTCLFLQEWLPDESPETTGALREALPGLVQPTDNYSLIFAEEFNGTPQTGECNNGMITLAAAAWNYDTNPCNDRDGSNLLCNNVQDGHYWMGRSAVCDPFVRTRGKFAYKYGYLEVKYTVQLVTAHGYRNYQLTIGDPRLPLRYRLADYGNDLSTNEKILRTIGATVNVFEYLPQELRQVSHRWINHGPYAFHAETVPGRSNISIYYRHTPVNAHDKDMNFCPDHGCGFDTSVTVTQGIEWTPRGYRTLIRVDDVHDDLTIVPKPKIEIQARDVNVSELGVVTFGSGLRTVTGTDRDRFFEYLVPGDDSSLLEQIGVSHVPMELDMSAWGYPRNRRMVARMAVDYIRVFQPDNGYLDMEPVFQ